jgi:translocation and assembly module TamA
LNKQKLFSMEKIQRTALFKIIVIVSLMFFLFLKLDALAENEISRPCPNLVIFAPEQIEFSDFERRMACGDTELSAWETIPRGQMELHLRAFLQERGYFGWTLEGDRQEWRIFLGEPVRIQVVRLEGVDEVIRPERKWDLFGRRLTRKTLDEWEQWLTRELHNEGFPCARINLNADGKTGEVLVEVTAGDRQRFGEIQREEIPGTAQGVVNRYDSFHENDLYQGWLLRLTEQRILRDNFLASTHFITRCEDGVATILQRSFAVAPRVFRFGAGLSTEEGPIFRGEWRSQRLAEYGSNLMVQALLSFREQRVRFSSDLYVLPWSFRQFLTPQVTLERVIEPEFQILRARLASPYSGRWDWNRNYFRLSFGPVLEISRSEEDFLKTDQTFLQAFWKSNLVWMSHDFEFYQENPHRGYRITGDFSWYDPITGSGIQTFRLETGFHYFQNLFRFDPPRYVLGFRGGVRTTIPYRGQETPLVELPPDLKSYLGGIANLRGFGRNQIPLDGRGGLTDFFFSSEARLSNTLPYGFDPLSFLDLGLLSQGRLSVDLPLYFSPGIGFRWDTFFGVFRGSAAYGMTAFRTEEDEEISNLQFYFSYGREF